MIEPSKTERKWFELGGRVWTFEFFIYIFPTLFFILEIIKIEDLFFRISLLLNLLLVDFLALHFTSKKLEQILTKYFYPQIFMEKEEKPVA